MGQFSASFLRSNIRARENSCLNWELQGPEIDFGQPYEVYIGKNCSLGSHSHLIHGANTNFEVVHAKPFCFVCDVCSNCSWSLRIDICKSLNTIFGVHTSFLISHRKCHSWLTWELMWMFLSLLSINFSGQPWCIGRRPLDHWTDKQVSSNLYHCPYPTKLSVTNCNPAKFSITITIAIPPGFLFKVEQQSLSLI